MIHAYDEEYLGDAMKCLGEAMDYAVYACGMDMDQFLNRFIVSGIADEFASGSPKIISGTSGTELVMRILGDADYPKPQIQYDRSPEYWCGWVLAYYQWYTGRSFKNIQKYLSMQDILKMYPTLHEASERKFVDVVNRRIRKENPPSRLQIQRKISNCSQRELAEKSGVNLRTLQQYESKARDINKAAGSILLALSKVLGCRIEDLLEYDVSEIE